MESSLKRLALKEKITKAIKKSWVDNPDMDWGVSSPEITEAEDRFERMAERYLVDEITGQDLYDVFNQRTAAYHKAQGHKPQLFDNQ